MSVCGIAVWYNGPVAHFGAADQEETDMSTRVHCFTGSAIVERSKRVATLDGRGWTSVADGKESATISVEIDVGAIIRYLGEKAMRNRSGRARGLGGLIKVKASDVQKVA
jgi:hypothetical protein